MRTPKYKQLTLSDLEWMVVPALQHGQVLIIDAQSKTIGVPAPVAAVLWARVSPEIDAQLAASPDKRIRLQPQDWSSGHIHWIIEAIGDPRVISTVVDRLRNKEWKGQLVRHRARGTDGKPMIRTLDPIPVA